MTMTSLATVHRLPRTPTGGTAHRPEHPPAAVLLPAEIDPLLSMLGPAASYVLAEPDGNIRRGLIIGLQAWLADLFDQALPATVCLSCHQNPVFDHGLCWSCGVA